jgi:hypothetical protein
MTYPPVIQLETRALEAEALTRLARERRAPEAEPSAAHRRLRLGRWLAPRRTRAACRAS